MQMTVLLTAQGNAEIEKMGAYIKESPDQPVKPGQRRVRIPSFTGPDKQAD